MDTHIKRGIKYDDNAEELSRHDRRGGGNARMVTNCNNETQQFRRIRRNEDME